jgi:ATP-dependent helicase/DNAse subunit B
MTKDSFSAVWLSHSSIGDYLKCPRLYYLRNIYKDPKTGHKMTIMTPPLALGQAVHEVVESLSQIETDKRLQEPLLENFEKVWLKVTGDKGGFRDEDQELHYKERGKKMLQRIIDHPGCILEKAIKIRQDLPHYWFSEEDNIILCGKIDWLRYCEDEDCVEVVDFKTGKIDENSDSLQLPIYLLLATNCQTKKVGKASYWYLDRDDERKNVQLPSISEAYDRVLEIARKIALARKLNHLVCKNGGCQHCEPMERIYKGEGKLVAESEYHQDIYILNYQKHPVVQLKP